jgi:hypothetical protein
MLSSGWKAGKHSKSNSLLPAEINHSSLTTTMCTELKIKIVLIRRVTDNVLLDKPLSDASYEECLQICKGCEYYLGCRFINLQLVEFANQNDVTILRAIESGDKLAIELDNLKLNW